MSKMSIDKWLKNSNKIITKKTTEIVQKHIAERDQERNKKRVEGGGASHVRAYSLINMYHLQN